jgi:hypothetical protein
LKNEPKPDSERTKSARMKNPRPQCKNQPDDGGSKAKCRNDKKIAIHRIVTVKSDPSLGNLSTLPEGRDLGPVDVSKAPDSIAG